MYSLLIAFIIFLGIYCILSYRKQYLNDNSHEEYDLLDTVVVKCRIDRYGSNVLHHWLPGLLYSMLSKKPLLHYCDKSCEKYKDTIFHKLLLDNCELIGKEEFDEYVSKKPPRYMYSDQQQYVVPEDITRYTKGVAMIDILNKKELKEPLYEYFKNESIVKQWTLPFRKDNSLLIHIRMGDVRDRPNGGVANEDTFQAFIGEKRLSHLIKKMKQTYPHHTIHLMVENNKQDIEYCKNVMKKLNIEPSVISNNDIDKDIWIMTQSDILITSRSTFSLLGALFHQGRKVYAYEPWRHYKDIIGYEYNKTYDNPHISLLEDI